MSSYSFVKIMYLSSHYVNLKLSKMDSAIFPVIKERFNKTNCFVIMLNK